MALYRSAFKFYGIKCTRDNQPEVLKFGERFGLREESDGRLYLYIDKFGCGDADAANEDESIRIQIPRRLKIHYGTYLLKEYHTLKLRWCSPDEMDRSMNILRVDGDRFICREISTPIIWEAFQWTGKPESILHPEGLEVRGDLMYVEDEGDICYPGDYIVYAPDSEDILIPMYYPKKKFEYEYEEYNEL